MFCDLIGSTELSTRLDPEEVRQVNRSYREACAAVIGRYDGLIASYMGDGIMVFFGYSQAYEDDAERSVRAGLAVVRAVRELEPLPGLSLRTRVGIATGLVVAGDLVGDGTAETQAVSGETPNLAARLQALAEPDAVVIDERTYRLVGGLFEYKDLGKRRLKGISEAVSCWHAVSERRVASRFEAAHEAGVTTFIGRDRESELLLERWQRAKEGQGQVVLVSGEPGIGKSRIIEALGERIAEEPHLRLRCQCSQYHTASSLYPVVVQLENAARFAPEDSPEKRLDKLEALVARSGEAAGELAPLLAALLSIPAGERYPPLEMTPQQRKEKLFEALVAELIRVASEQPTLIFFEDAHWIDPTTLELLDLIVGRIRTERLLLLVTFRPEFTLPWTERSYVTPVALTSLDRGHCVSLVETVAQGKALPQEVLDRIVDKTDGVPLFIEELTKAVIESDVLREDDDRYVLRGLLTDPAIPSTLQDSLEARLDRLAEAKAVAQVGAVIGRGFPYGLLAAVSPLNDAALQDALNRLVAAGLALRTGSLPRATFTFKHSLIRDVAYESLLKSRRRELHARIAEQLEAEFPERAESEPEVLAHHFTEAQLFEQAVGYWRRAGKRATEQSANAEAAEHLTRALALLDRCTAEGRPRDELELDLQIALAGSLIAAKGYSAPETERTYARALELCERVGETPQIFPVLYGRWVFHVMSGEVATSHELAREFSHLAERQKTDAQRLVGHRVLGTSLTILGELAAASGHLDKALALYDPEKHRSLTFLYGQDVGVAGSCYKSLALWLLGHPEQALEIGQQVIERARALSHPNSLAYAVLHVGALLHGLCSPGEPLMNFAEWIHRLAIENQLPLFEAAWPYFAGWSLVDGKEKQRGVAMMRDSRDRLSAAHVAYMLPILSTFHARGCCALGRIEEGLKILDEAQEVMGTRGERWFAAELHRVRGDLLAADATGDREAAGACFRQAIAVSRSQGSRSLELRAATSLARLLRDQHRDREARETLRPVLEWFDEGFDLLDLKRARALLDELSS
jgi:predicted ATPase/class 3 adenylate cyclase